MVYAVPRRQNTPRNRYVYVPFSKMKRLRIAHAYTRTSLFGKYSWSVPATRKDSILNAELTIFGTGP